MANTTSGTTTFDKTFSIDEIIEESYNRLGQFDMSGYNLKTARRSLNIMFQEWGNRGLHFWEVANTNITLETNKNEYRIFRATSDGNSDGVTSTLTAAIASLQLQPLELQLLQKIVCQTLVLSMLDRKIFLTRDLVV